MQKTQAKLQCLSNVGMKYLERKQSMKANETYALITDLIRFREAYKVLIKDYKNEVEILIEAFDRQIVILVRNIHCLHLIL